MKERAWRDLRETLSSFLPFVVVRLFECKAQGTFKQQRSKQRMPDLNSDSGAVTQKCVHERGTVT